MKDAEIGRIVRLALRGKRIKRRRRYGPSPAECYGAKRGMPGYMESDNDFLDNNSDAAVAVLEAMSK